MDITARIQKFRTDHGLSQRRLAELLGLPAAGGQVTVTRWESGAQRPPPYLDRALNDLGRELAERESVSRAKSGTNDLCP